MALPSKRSFSLDNGSFFLVKTDPSKIKKELGQAVKKNLVINHGGGRPKDPALQELPLPILIDRYPLRVVGNRKNIVMGLFSARDNDLHSILSPNEISDLMFRLRASANVSNGWLNRIIAAQKNDPDGQYMQDNQWAAFLTPLALDTKAWAQVEALLSQSVAGIFDSADVNTYKTDQGIFYSFIEMVKNLMYVFMGYYDILEEWLDFYELHLHTKVENATGGSTPPNDLSGIAKQLMSFYSVNNATEVSPLLAKFGKPIVPSEPEEDEEPKKETTPTQTEDRIPHMKAEYKKLVAALKGDVNAVNPQGFKYTSEANDAIDGWKEGLFDPMFSYGADPVALTESAVDHLELVFSSDLLRYFLTESEIRQYPKWTNPYAQKSGNIYSYSFDRLYAEILKVVNEFESKIKEYFIMLDYKATADKEHIARQIVLKAWKDPDTQRELVAFMLTVPILTMILNKEQNYAVGPFVEMTELAHIDSQISLICFRKSLSKFKDNAHRALFPEVLERMGIII